MTIEDHLKLESENFKEVYDILPEVIEFEQILQKCFTSICDTCMSQYSLWIHMQHSFVDLNILAKDGDDISKYSRETAEYWKQLCEINPNYPQAIHKYAAYQKIVQNNQQYSNQLEEKYKTEIYKKSLANSVNRNDILFRDDTAVVIISGSKESLGKILKINKGAGVLFGFRKNELLQNSVNKIMPHAIGIHHDELMEAFFKTGKSKIMNQERSLFGIHQNGYCFPVKLLVKPMPQLENGMINYVGMATSRQTDRECILTDMQGNISCITENLAKTMKISPAWFNKGSGINVTMFAPELLDVFFENENTEEKRKKYKETGGSEISLYIPDEIECLIVESQGQNTQINKKSSNKRASTCALLKFNTILTRKKGNTKNEIGVRENDLLDLPQYINYKSKTIAKCHLQEMYFSCGKIII